MFNIFLKNIKNRNYQWLFMISPGLILLLVFFAIPMFYMIIVGFLEYDYITIYRSIFTLDNYIRFFSDPYFLKMITNSLRVGLFSTFLALILAYPLANYLTKISGWERTIISSACLLPIFVTIVIGTLGWWIILLPNGVLSQSLKSLGLIKKSLRILQTMPSLIVVLAHLHMPYAILILTSGFQSIPEEKIFAASILGASDIKIFQKIVFPLMIPAILSSGILVFSLTISSYLIPILITGQHLRVLPIGIYTYTTDLLNWPFASVLAVILLVIVVILVYGITAFTSYITKRGQWEMI